MEKNMGIADRIIRPSLALGFIALFATKKVTGAAGIALLTFAGIFLATSSVGYCPAYDLAGIESISEGEKV